MNLTEILQSSETLVCVGSGGVGKTTTSAALGLAAADLGLKVVVLTVDPARRLATTLGLKMDTSQEVQVCKTSQGGELWACMVQAPEIFNQFVRDAAPNPESAEKLLRNPLYQQLSQRLNGSQEFTSLEKLYQLRQRKYFDLIILDTPPSQNAADFLQAPDRILNLFQDSITAWFLSPEDPGFLRTLLGFGTKKALKSLEFLTGSGFIHELIDFFGAMRSFQRNLRNHAEEVRNVLRAQGTQFILVTGFDAAKLSEAEQVMVDLKAQNFLLAAVVVNRAVPLWMQSPVTDQDVQSVSPQLKKLYLDTLDYYQKRLTQYQQFAHVQNERSQVYLLPQLLEESLNGLEGLRNLYHSFRP